METVALVESLIGANTTYAPSFQTFGSVPFSFVFWSVAFLGAIKASEDVG